MRATLTLVLTMMACVVAEDPMASTSSGAESSGDPTSGSTSTTDSSTASSTSTTMSTSTTSSSTSSSDASTDTTAADSSTGEPCEPDAVFTEVEGCAEPVGEPFCSEGQQHVDAGTDIPWIADPPHSGPHYPMWETWGEHEDVVPRGNWVHNLEHGGIVLTYRCNDDCEPEVDVLREVVAMRPDLRILLTADPMLPGDERFAAIAWTWVHRFDAPDLATLLCFADQHENHAPEDVP